MFWFYFDTFIWFLWQLPQNLIALLMMAFLGKKTLVRSEIYTWIFVCDRMSGGISLGNFVFLSPQSNKEATIRHELGHVIQSHMFGWSYLLIIGLPSLLWAWLCPKDKCYYDFFTEKWANQLSGLKVGRNQYSCYLYIPKEEENDKQ